MNLSDLIADNLRKGFDKDLLIITEEGLPIRLMPNQAGFHLYTPHKSVCWNFGLTHQSMSGYLSRGKSKHPVNQPEVGMQIFFNGYAHTRTQKIIRIYDRPLRKLIPHLKSYVRMLLTSLDEIGKYPVGWNTNTLIGTDADKFYNPLIEYLLYSAISLPVYTGNGWGLSHLNSTMLKFLAISDFNVCIDDLYKSELITENNLGQVEISDALVALLLISINNKCPENTKFNRDGLLLIA
jgi:hypothetical protein